MGRTDDRILQRVSTQIVGDDDDDVGFDSHVDMLLPSELILSE
jgi:hypothetical protein